MTENKLKLAFDWAASCGGCEIAFVDINEKILDGWARFTCTVYPFQFLSEGQFTKRGKRNGKQNRYC